MVKSLRWVLQGIFWDATIEPVTKMTAASLRLYRREPRGVPVHGRGPGRGGNDKAGR